MAEEFNVLDAGLPEPIVDHLRQLVISIAQLNVGVLQSFYHAPEKPRRGQIALADGDHWDPLELGPPSYPVWYNDETSSWTAF